MIISGTADLEGKRGNLMTVLKGIIPPIITPMNEDESINESELRRQVNRLIEAGVVSIWNERRRLHTK